MEKTVTVATTWDVCKQSGRTVPVPVHITVSESTQRITVGAWQNDRLDTAEIREHATCFAEEAESLIREILSEEIIGQSWTRNGGDLERIFLQACGLPESLEYIEALNDALCPSDQTAVRVHLRWKTNEEGVQRGNRVCGIQRETLEPGEVTDLIDEEKQSVDREEGSAGKNAPPKKPPAKNGEDEAETVRRNQGERSVGERASSKTASRKKET